MNLSDFEDFPIIGTERYGPFQEMVSRAGEFAVYEAKKRGLPITGVDKDGNIVKNHPDGTREIIGKVPPRVKLNQTVWDIGDE